jgi:hypothetical protein
MKKTRIMSINVSKMRPKHPFFTPKQVISRVKTAPKPSKSGQISPKTALFQPKTGRFPGQNSPFWGPK